MRFTEFKNVIDLVNKFDTEQKCIDHLTEMRWQGNVVSPFDETSKVYKCKGNKYRCKMTGKYFNVRTGTMFDDTKMPLQKWFMAIYLIASHKKGISSYQLARDLGITQKSAWFMLHRIRYSFGSEHVTPMLDNIVEIDETYIGGKESNKHKSKRMDITGNVNRTPVVGMLERGGNIIARTSKMTDGKTLKPMIYKNVKAGATIMTDGFGAYTGLSRNYNHIVINHQEGIYAIGNNHTNSIEGFWSLFKRGVLGIYHFVSPKHLDSYLTEFTYRYNTRKISESERFALVLSNTANKRLRYLELVNK